MRSHEPSPISILERAQGCLLGQLAGDSLGSLVEFSTPQEIRCDYPGGVRELSDGGTWDTLAGQPTDDSELALVMARMLADKKKYDPKQAMKAYRYWLSSGPFDCGMTISAALQGNPNQESQANGAMMRVSPLGIFGSNHPLSKVAKWARKDAALTHPHPVCVQANALYTMAIAQAICTGCEAEELYLQIVDWAKKMKVEESLLEAVGKSSTAPPADYVNQQGWVLTAFGNALWQLTHAPDFEEGVVDTVMRGGDTDTNAAICGALLGAVYGRGAVPSQWVTKLLNCRPEAEKPNVRRPRPECFWPVDALELADRLVANDLH